MFRRSRLSIDCSGTTLVGIVIILLLYTNDIVLMEKSLYDLDKKLSVFTDFFSSMGMLVNIGKTMVMTIESKNITYMLISCMKKSTGRK